MSGHTKLWPALLAVSGLLSCGISASCNRADPSEPRPTTPKASAAQATANTPSKAAETTAPKPPTKRPVPESARREIEAMLGPKELEPPKLKAPARDVVKTEAVPVTVSGVARNAKAGAIVVKEGQEPWYVAGLYEWPPGLLGERVEVSGTARRVKLAPDPARGPDKSTGQRGLARRINGAKWRKLP